MIQFVVVVFETVPWEKNWRLEKEQRPPRQQHCKNQLEYLEEFWKPEETCCHSDSSENSSVKNLQGLR